jgi:hypothetical protein
MSEKLRRCPGRHARIWVAALLAATALAACSTISSMNDTVGSTADQLRDRARSAAGTVGNSIRSTADAVNDKVAPAEDKFGDAIADNLPASLGGLPAGLPPRQTAPAFLAVHDMPPQRELKSMTVEQRKKLETDLKAMRDQQEKLNPNSQAPGATPPVVQAVPPKKPIPAKPATGQPHGKQPADPSRSADAQPGR